MSSEDSSAFVAPARLEAFSDGVLAIVITLLVLEIKVPDLENPLSGQEAWKALLVLAPKFIGYLLSFFFVAVFWVNHHRFFRLIQHVDDGLLWLNVVLLLALSFIPFPTGMIGEYPRNSASLVLFATILLLGGVAFNLMWRHALRRDLFQSGVHRDVAKKAIAKGLWGPCLYGLSAALAFVFPLGCWILLVTIPFIYFFKRS
jgi:uncharacterized membrane protein